jgi:hypothetical protein
MMWEKYGSGGQAADVNAIRSMEFVCLITRATDTHPEHVIRTAFPRQQWLYESAPQCYKLIACLVQNSKFLNFVHDVHIYVFGMDPRENKTVIIPLIGFRNRDGVFTARYEINLNM